MNRIKEVIKEKKRTQVWVANMIGKSQGTVALYANNKLQPTLDILFKIAECLEVNPKSLIDSNLTLRKSTK